MPILTAHAMRSADAAAIAAGTPGVELMRRAGVAVADAVSACTGPAPTLVVCGPGNNGGDGYVAARLLAERGWPVRVAASAPPATAEALNAANGWAGPVEPLTDALPASILIDALFGTGLARPLEGAVGQSLDRRAAAAGFVAAVDLPSGVDSDSGAILGCPYAADITIALAAPKPVHLLFPAASRIGRLIVADIGIACDSDWRRLERPRLAAPDWRDHKYRRGSVAVIAGAMTGAAWLAASGAIGAGAGYVSLIGDDIASPLLAVVRRPWSDDVLDDERIGALVVGPGLGAAAADREHLIAALTAGRPVVVDAGALTLLAESAVPLARRLAGVAAVLTPHEGEFHRLFGDLPGNRIERAVAAARTSGAVMLLKGPDSIVAAPDGRALVASNPCFWLSAAGTGDVLAGAVGAMLARGLDPFTAAGAALWLHGRAGHLAGPALVADELPTALRQALDEVTGG